VQILTTVTLGDGDALQFTAEHAATQVLAALGGNPTRDGSTVIVRQDSTGSAGARPGPQQGPIPPEPAPTA
jgi:hypothetical protein